MDGPLVLLRMIEMGISAYSAAFTVSAKKDIAVIAATAAEMLSLSEEAIEQLKDFRTSTEHMSHSWNKLAEYDQLYVRNRQKNP